MKSVTSSIHARHIMRIALTTCAALVVTAAAVVSVAGPAQAQPVSITCSGMQTFTYHPGLRFEPQEVQVGGGAVFKCPVSTDPMITSGHYDVDSLATVHCGFSTSSGESIYVWNTNESSTVSWSLPVPLRLGVTEIVYTGTVTAGKFLGADLIGTLTLLPSGGLLDCIDQDGVTMASGVIGFTLLS